MIGQPSRVHATGDIYCVTPDVILGLAGSDDSGNNRADVDPDPDHEVVVGVIVDVLELLTHAKDIFDKLEFR